MQSHQGFGSHWPPAQHPTSAAADDNNSPVMSATSGPVDHHFFWQPQSPTEPASPDELRHTQSLPQQQQQSPPSVPMSRPPVPMEQRLAPKPPGSQYHTLSNAKSTPVLLPSQPEGRVKNMANKFDQAGAGDGRQPPQLTVRTSQERYRRPVGRTPRSPTKDGVRKLQKSPTKDDHRRLQKKRSEQRSPTKSAATSFETENSFGSTSTVMSTKSQPPLTFSPQKQAQLPYSNARPLFGEITSDGRWNGNFDINDYGSLSPAAQQNRRSSEGATALGHGRSQSHQDILQPASTTALSPPQPHALNHKRSRSEMDTYGQNLAPPSMPNLATYHAPPNLPTPPNSGTRNPLRKESPTSRIPVRNRRLSKDSAGSSTPQSRSASALSNPPLTRHRLSKSPTRRTQPNGKENVTPSSASRSRYHPPPLSTTNSGQSLQAKIVAPPPKTSPPLRSSRPRQPVSSATTSASRARAAERFQGQTPRDGRRPSEQWLGKPYDAQKERSRRNIPELGKIDFEARRERIQKAISQNLEESRSNESLKDGVGRPRQASNELDARAGAPMEEDEALNSADARQAELMNRETDSMPGGWPTPGGLSVDTFNVPSQQEREPEPQTANTAHTEFEMDESPILGRPSTEEDQRAQPVLTGLQMLTSATYRQPPPKAPSPLLIAKETPAEEVQSPSVLENVLRMRERSDSQAGSDYFDNSAVNSAEDSPSDLGDRWGTGNGLQSVAGSIKIMLDDEPPNNPHYATRSWSQNVHDELRHAGAGAGEVQQVQYLNDRAYVSNSFTQSPASDHDNRDEEELQVTPRKRLGRDDTVRQSDYARSLAFPANGEGATDPAVAKLLAEYQSGRSLSQDSLAEVQKHMVDLQRMSSNQGSNGFMIQSLLDSILDVQGQQSSAPEEQKQETLPSTTYDVPEVTPDTPPGWDYGASTGTAVVFRKDTDVEPPLTEEQQEEEDFYVKIRKADEAWERQQRGEYLRLETEEDDKPDPPPKDLGYTPRSSIGPNSAIFPPDLSAGLRISTASQFDPQDARSTESPAELKPLELPLSAVSAPPLPSYAPPIPPPASASTSRQPVGLFEPPQLPATYSERASSEVSPVARKSVWGQSGSSRPSIDSQRMPGPPPLPASVSMTSFTDSGRKISMDTGNDAQSRSGKGTSPGPEQKRLQRRRNIIKELLDTEYTYHQDLKIIEDIYKATAVADLISPEDKKVLFGNCDDIEHFSLQFYDELRKAVSAVYVPAKSMRWMNKRGSYSTTQSETTTQGSMMTQESADDEKDKTTTVGNVFIQNLQRMEVVYSIYLKNHDAANQRLSALRSTPTVKCWLDECHNNASDITSAWDLDSLLVKPTQRVAKYPMLLQQLVEVTPQSHPDREALTSAAKDSISMLTRINDAKKRADLVDQIVNRKRKDSDVRSGIAKAFGRRTEKLKERVGIAEAFQDPDFDQLAHKFGGHYIRLQICLRDVQAYMDRTEKAMEQVNNYAYALDLFTDVTSSSGSEQESKWRKYGQAVREITSIAFLDHKAAVHKRVIDPMIACIKLHRGPENAIANRKRRIIDYAKCQSVEKRGEKPDKKMIEASDLYVALNDQLKIELPKLYSLTSGLVQGCLNCFLGIQVSWHHTWERKLRPVLEAKDIPTTIAQIEPAFRADFDFMQNELVKLGICNGAVLAESANFLSPSTTFEGNETPSSKRPSTLESSKRTMSVGSESSPDPRPYNRRSSSYAAAGSDALTFAQDVRFRPSSSMSNHGGPTSTPGSGMLPNQPWSSDGNTPTSSFTQSRPATANQPSTQQLVLLPLRSSAEHPRSPRPASGATYFTARPGQDANEERFSGLFSSAVPADTPTSTRTASPVGASGIHRTMFVCASLFEFSIDKTRREGGYPYLTYVQGEVFDVVGQKGELWLAKNQDDSNNSLGWIWEQHFVILSQD